MLEEWCLVSEFPRYEISSRGRVRRSDTGRLMSVRANWKGYKTVALYGGGNAYKRYVARLICIAWHGEPPFDGAQAAHLDGSRDNNVPENIAWATCSENNLQKREHGTALRGSANHLCKLTVDAVLEIRAASQRGESNCAIGDRWGVSGSTIQAIKDGRSWAWLSNDNHREAGCSNKAPASNNGD